MHIQSTETMYVQCIPNKNQIVPKIILKIKVKLERKIII